MISSIKKFFGIKEKPTLNPAIFNHPLAEKTAWHPKARGGSNFKTRILKEVSSSELHYKGSSWSLFFSLVFIIMPIIFIVVFLGSDVFGSDNGFKYSSFLFLLFPAVGCYLLFTHLRPIVFDKRIGYFYKSFKKPVNSLHHTKNKNHIKLDTIEALQIIPEYVRTKNSSYTSYELNFVFEDGLRYNVVDHANYETIRKDAKTISDFLGVPYWDAVRLYAYTPVNERQDLDKPYSSTGRFRDM